MNKVNGAETYKTPKNQNSQKLLNPNQKKIPRDKISASYNQGPLAPSINIQSIKNSKNKISSTEDTKKENRETYNKRREELLKKELLMLDISEEACEVLIKTIKTVQLSDKFSLVSNLIFALDKEIYSLIDYYKASVRVNTVIEELNCLQTSFYNLALYSLIKEIAIHLNNKTVLFSTKNNDFLNLMTPSADHISQKISELGIKKTAFESIIASKKFQNEFQSAFPRIKNKVVVHNKIKNRTLKQYDAIEKLFKTLAEFLKLMEKMESVLCVQNIFERDVFEEDPIKEEFKGFDHCFTEVYEKGKKLGYLGTDLLDSLVSSYKEIFEILFKKMDTILSEEEYFQNLNLVESYKNKTKEDIRPLCDAYYNSLSKYLNAQSESPSMENNSDSLLFMFNSYTFYLFFTDYSISLFKRMLNSIEKKNPYTISKKADIQINVIWKKLNIIKDENSFDIVPYLIDDFTKLLNRYSILEKGNGKIPKFFEEILDLSKCNIEEIIQKVNKIIDNNFNFYNWKLAKIEFQELEKEIDIFNTKLTEGCGELENILASSTLTFDEFQFLKGKILTFNTDISDILKPIVDLPSVLDNLLKLKKSKSDQKKIIEINLEEELDFPIDFEKLESEIVFKKFLDAPSEDITENSLVSSEKEDIAEPSSKEQNVETSWEDLVTEVSPVESTIETTLQQPINIEETPKKEKRKDNLGKIPRTVKRNKILEFLQERGYQKIRMNGSHAIFQHPETHNLTVVPTNKNDLHKGTYNSILSQVGVRRKKGY